MAKKKKTKLGTLGLVLILVGLAGAVLSVVGLFVSWFAGSVTAFGKTGTEYYGLFHDFKFLSDKAFPLAVVQAFGIVAAVTAVVSAALMLLKTFGIVKVSGFAKLLVAAATIAVGVLALVFTFSFVGSLGGIDAGELGGAGFAPAFGAFFTGIGGIAAGAAFLLKK